MLDEGGSLDNKFCTRLAFRAGTLNTFKFLLFKKQILDADTDLDVSQ